MSQTSIISEWISNIEWEDLPPDVVRQAKKCFLDFLGCTAGGAQFRPGKICAQLAGSWKGPTEATIIGSPNAVSARHAAWANGSMANALDYDDTLYGHPGSATWSASLAAAEKWQTSGMEFLLAAVIGYEVSVRAGALLKPIIPRYLAMWDSATLHSYGAAAAAAKLAGLSPDGISNALGLVSGTAPVPKPRKKRFPGEGRPDLKAGFGWAADAGIVAAEMTLAGFSGPGHVFDDNMGFWEISPSIDLGIRSFTDKLGDLWSIRNVSFKPYMACRFVHPILQGVEELMRGKPVDPEAIRKVQISSFSLLGDEHHFIRRPVSGIDAQFSVPYTLAAMLTKGHLTPSTYEQITLNDTNVLSMADRVEFKLASEFEQAYPERLGARVRIDWRNGRSDEIIIENPKGSPEDPMTDLDLRKKYLSLAAPLFGQKNSEDIIASVEKLDAAPKLESLSNLLRTL